MKKAFIAVLVALLALGGNAMAQKTIKLGHINSNDLMQIMPSRAICPGLYGDPSGIR